MTPAEELAKLEREEELERLEKEEAASETPRGAPVMPTMRVPATATASVDPRQFEVPPPETPIPRQPSLHPDFEGGFTSTLQRPAKVPMSTPFGAPPPPLPQPSIGVDVAGRMAEGAIRGTGELLAEPFRAAASLPGQALVALSPPDVVRPGKGSATFTPDPRTSREIAMEGERGIGQDVATLGMTAAPLVAPLTMLPLGAYGAYEGLKQMRGAKTPEEFGEAAALFGGSGVMGLAGLRDAPAVTRPVSDLVRPEIRQLFRQPETPPMQSGVPPLPPQAGQLGVVETAALKEGRPKLQIARLRELQDELRLGEQQQGDIAKLRELEPALREAEMKRAVDEGQATTEWARELEEKARMDREKAASDARAKVFRELDRRKQELAEKSDVMQARVEAALEAQKLRQLREIESGLRRMTKERVMPEQLESALRATTIEGGYERPVPQAPPGEVPEVAPRPSRAKGWRPGPDEPTALPEDVFRRESKKMEAAELKASIVPKIEEPPPFEPGYADRVTVDILNRLEAIENRQLGRSMEREAVGEAPARVLPRDVVNPEQNIHEPWGPSIRIEPEVTRPTGMAEPTSVPTVKPATPPPPAGGPGVKIVPLPPGNENNRFYRPVEITQPPKYERLTGKYDLRKAQHGHPQFNWFERTGLTRDAAEGEAQYRYRADRILAEQYGEDWVKGMQDFANRIGNTPVGHEMLANLKEGKPLSPEETALYQKHKAEIDKRIQFWREYRDWTMKAGLPEGEIENYMPYYSRNVGDILKQRAGLPNKFAGPTTSVYGHLERHRTGGRPKGTTIDILEDEVKYIHETQRKQHMRPREEHVIEMMKQAKEAGDVGELQLLEKWLNRMKGLLDPDAVAVNELLFRELEKTPVAVGDTFEGDGLYKPAVPIRIVKEFDWHPEAAKKAGKPAEKRYSIEVGGQTDPVPYSRHDILFLKYANTPLTALQKKGMVSLAKEAASLWVVAGRTTSMFNALLWNTARVMGETPVRDWPAGAAAVARYLTGTLSPEKVARWKARGIIGGDSALDMLQEWNKTTVPSLKTDTSLAGKYSRVRNVGYFNVKAPDAIAKVFIQETAEHGLAREHPGWSPTQVESAAQMRTAYATDLAGRAFTTVEGSNEAIQVIRFLQESTLRQAERFEKAVRDRDYAWVAKAGGAAGVLVYGWMEATGGSFDDAKKVFGSLIPFTGLFFGGSGPFSILGKEGKELFKVADDFVTYGEVQRGDVEKLLPGAIRDPLRAWQTDSVAPMVRSGAGPKAGHLEDRPQKKREWRNRKLDERLRQQDNPTVWRE